MSAEVVEEFLLEDFEFTPVKESEEGSPVGQEIVDMTRFCSGCR